MQQESKLSVRDVKKSYGAVVALSSTSFDMRSGEFLTLLGPSGSGKTTLLWAIAGLSDLDSGEISIDGKDVTMLPPYKRDIGMVFQSYALFPHLTIFENIAFPLRMRKEPNAHIVEKVRKVLEVVELPHVGDRLPAELSGGQQQRIALARSIVYSPSIILMDEPLGALDKKLRDNLKREIRQLHRKLGATILYVTHDQEEAMALSDRVCVMNNAKIEQIGSPSELYFKPATMFVAEFLGESNLIEATVKEISPDCITVTGPGNSLIKALRREGLKSGQKVRFLVRPESISMPAQEVHENRLEAVVRESLMIGQTTKLFVELPCGTELSCTQLTRDGSAIKPGENVHLSWSRDSTVVLVK
jgi:putative spermidine/putrescine transport system ATP-binding protein